MRCELCHQEVHKSKERFSVWGRKGSALMSAPAQLRKGELRSSEPWKYHIPSGLGSKLIDTELAVGGVASEQERGSGN